MIWGENHPYFWKHPYVLHPVRTSSHLGRAKQWNYPPRERENISPTSLTDMFEPIFPTSREWWVPCFLVPCKGFNSLVLLMLQKSGDHQWIDSLSHYLQYKVLNIPGIQNSRRISGKTINSIIKGILATPPQSYPPQEIAGLMIRVY